MLLAIMDTILPSVQRESTAPRRKRLSRAYISDTRYQDAISHLRKDTVVLDFASEQDLDRYLSERPIDDLLFQQVLKGMLHYLPHETRTLLFRILYILRYVPLLQGGMFARSCVTRRSRTFPVLKLELCC